MLVAGTFSWTGDCCRWTAKINFFVTRRSTHRRWVLFAITGKLCNLHKWKKIFLHSSFHLCNEKQFPFNLLSLLFRFDLINPPRTLFFHIFQWFYYFAIVEDLILRFGWTLSMSLIEMGYMESDLVVSLLAPLEVFRRFIWNYFRLENEHLNNCGNFRAVRDISVAPISGTSDEVMIVKMMDEDDGVINRRTKKVGKKKEHRLLLNGMSESQDLDMIWTRNNSQGESTETFSIDDDDNPERERRKPWSRAIFFAFH